MEYAELIEKAKKGRSAAKLAADIGVSKSLLTDVIKGEKPCPEWVAAKLAEEAGVNPVVVVFENLKTKAKNEEQRGLWERLILQTARALTIAVAVGLLSFAPLKVEAAEHKPTCAENIHYGLLLILLAVAVLTTWACWRL